MFVLVFVCELDIGLEFVCVRKRVVVRIGVCVFE